MKECADKKQIRRFGKFKIDSRLYKSLIAERKADKDNEKKRMEAILGLSKNRGLLAKNERELKLELAKKKVDKVIDNLKD